MKIAVLRGTGRTGRFVIQSLRARAHAVTVLVRPAGCIAELGYVSSVRGDLADVRALRDVVQGPDVVISALGSTGRDAGLMGGTAAALTIATVEATVRRFVGESVAGMTLRGDPKRPWDAAISMLLKAFGGVFAVDQRNEHRIWSDADLSRTLLREPRLVDRPAGAVDVDAHRSCRRSTLSRESLANLLVSVVQDHDDPREEPFVSDRKS